MSTAEEIGERVLATLRAQANVNRQSAAALRSQVLAVLAQHPGATASAVRARLDVDPLPSLRTVQEHLRAIRAASSVSRGGLMQDDTHGQ